ncbi:hypothetical protein N0V90_013184 [Kalmusia sp. IMI 367209]|nr:hypothetical protein N0V90_013184 [Kalmusia sp. IMI 367209]
MSTFREYIGALGDDRASNIKNSDHVVMFSAVYNSLVHDVGDSGKPEKLSLRDHVKTPHQVVTSAFHLEYVAIVTQPARELPQVFPTAEHRNVLVTASRAQGHFPQISDQEVLQFWYRLRLFTDAVNVQSTAVLSKGELVRSKEAPISSFIAPEDARNNDHVLVQMLLRASEDSGFDKEFFSTATPFMVEFTKELLRRADFVVTTPIHACSDMVRGCFGPQFIVIEDAPRMREIQKAMLMNAYPSAHYRPQNDDLYQLWLGSFTPRDRATFATQTSTPLMERLVVNGVKVYYLTTVRRFHNAAVFRLCQLANVGRDVQMHPSADIPLIGQITT